MGPEIAVAEALRRARGAALAWARTPIAVRLVVMRRLRRLIGARAREVAQSVGASRPVADTLAAEVLPLAEAARFLAGTGARILAPQRLGLWGRPWWLMGVSAEIRRDPVGVVLVLGPANYPLFLPGAQVLQALAAGNAVCVKPAAGGVSPMAVLSALLAEAGLPPGVFTVLGDSAEAGAAAVRAGFDHIVLTGSAETGRHVLAAAAETLTPATVELSGNDAVFVLPGADLALVVACLGYGVRLNHGATCIAPRRIFVPHALAGELEARLVAAFAGGVAPPIPPAVSSRLDRLAAQAVAMGARRLDGTVVLLADATPAMALLREDVFAPWLALVPVGGMDEAIEAASQCPFALGASVFGPEAEARVLAGRVPAGSVCVNDLIVPTADPRLPFGGRGRSGFGVTRGAEGLLAMTRLRTVSVRRGRLRPHLDPRQAADPVRMAGLIAVLHAGWRGWASGMRKLAGSRGS